MTKDRENYRRKLEDETKSRKKFEAAYRALQSKTNLNQATTQLETRKNRDINDTLSRRKEEIAELNRMMQHQTIEISNLQAEKSKLEKRVNTYEKKLSQYDDSFYALEARNVRDRTRMEEMGKAKNKAEGEKNVFKHMLEQAHERWLRERQELFRDALHKVRVPRQPATCSLRPHASKPATPCAQPATPCIPACNPMAPSGGDPTP